MTCPQDLSIYWNRHIHSVSGVWAWSTHTNMISCPCNHYRSHSFTFTTSFRTNCATFATPSAKLSVFSKLYVLYWSYNNPILATWVHLWANYVLTYRPFDVFNPINPNNPSGYPIDYCIYLLPTYGQFSSQTHFMYDRSHI